LVSMWDFCHGAPLRLLQLVTLPGVKITGLLLKVDSRSTYRQLHVCRPLAIGSRVFKEPLDSSSSEFGGYDFRYSKHHQSLGAGMGL
jgi:hypothetical protein